MMNLKNLCLIACATVLSIANSPIANAEELTIPISLIDEEGVTEQIGTIAVEDTDYGLLFTPDLTNVPPGIHGFHVHENPSCDPGIQDGEMKAGLAAGGHYDPDETGSHQGPYREGHLGDLPPLIADADGNVTLPILAPRLYPEDIQGRALMIHSGGDNFSDEPETLGGGGSRLACGVVE